MHLHTSTSIVGACGPGCGTHPWLCVSCRAVIIPMARDCDWGGCAVGAGPRVCRHRVVCAVQVSRMETVFQQSNLHSQPALHSGLPFVFAGEGSLCLSKLRRIIKKIEKRWSQEILPLGRIMCSSSFGHVPLCPSQAGKLLSQLLSALEFLEQ